MHFAENNLNVVQKTSYSLSLPLSDLQYHLPVTCTEGKNRQIRNVFGALGCKCFATAIIGLPKAQYTLFENIFFAKLLLFDSVMFYN